MHFVACALHSEPTMPDNTFSTIDALSLSDVTGGCGGRRRCHGCCGGNKQVSIVNNYGGAPAAAPAAAPSGGGLSVDVSAGYATA